MNSSSLAPFYWFSKWAYLNLPLSADMLARIDALLEHGQPRVVFMALRGKKI
jgi:hypothetical protein